MNGDPQLIMATKRGIREWVALLPRAIVRRFRHQWALAKAGRQSIRRLQTQTPRRLLVMCYGNIYRSPFVAAWLEMRIPASRGFEIRSAGFHSVTSRASPQDYVQLVSEQRIDLRSHRSRLVTLADLEWADVIVIMDRYNWERLSLFGTSVQEKIVWLGAFAAGGPVEIEDPYALPTPRVQTIVGQMGRAADGLVKLLLKGDA